MKVKGVLRAAMCTGVLWAAGSGLASAQDRERVIIGVNVTATPAPQSLKEAAAGTGLTLVGTNTQLAPSVDVRIAGRLGVGIRPTWFGMEVANGLVKGHETGVDLSASVELSSVSRTSAKVFGGPTFYRFGADVLGIKDVVTESGVGYNVGGDMSYFFSKAVGAGGTVWVSRTGEDTYTHFGGGVRFRF